MQNALPARVNTPSVVRLLRVPGPAAPPPRAPPTATRPPPGPTAKPGFLAWMRLHKVAAVAITTLLVVAIAAAAILAILQSVTTTPSTKAPLVAFQNGGDYVSINAAGFATVTLGSSGASATLALSGVSGAASVSLGNVLKLNNLDATHPETVTLSRSTTLNSAITSFTVTVKNGATTLVTWDAVAASSSSSFTLPVSTAADINIALVVTDGTAAGSLGSFSMDFTMTPT